MSMERIMNNINNEIITIKTRDETGVVKLTYDSVLTKNSFASIYKRT